MKYISPEVEILELEEVDVICTSNGEGGTGGETGDGTDPGNRVPTPGQNQGDIF